MMRPFLAIFFLTTLFAFAEEPQLFKGWIEEKEEVFIFNVPTAPWAWDSYTVEFISPKLIPKAKKLSAQEFPEGMVGLNTIHHVKAVKKGTTLLIYDLDSSLPW